MRSLVRLSLLGATLLAAAPAVAQDDDSDLDDIPHITLLGTAQEDVAPDLATISLGVVTDLPTAKAAADETARRAEAVIGAARGLGISSADIQTQALSLTQTYDTSDGQTQKPRGYEAANTMRIRIRDVSRAGTVAQALIEKGANRFDGIEFGLEHPEPIEARVLAMAIRNARLQALAASEAAGMRLGRVLRIEPPVAGGAYGGMRPMVQAKAAAPQRMPVEVGTSSVSVTIEVMWALDPR